MSVVGEFLTLNIGEEVARIVYGLCLVLVVFFPDGLVGILGRLQVVRKPEFGGKHAVER